MLKQRNEQIQVLVRIGDAFICVAAFFLALGLRYSTLIPKNDVAIQSFDSLAWILAASISIHMILYPMMGYYTSLRLKTIPQIVSMAFRGLLAEAFILGSLVFFFQAKTTSRWFFGLFLALNYGMILLERVGARTLLFTIRRRGYNYRQILIVGTQRNARQVIEVFKRNKRWGYIPFGILAEEASTSHQAIEGVPVVGGISDLSLIIQRQTVDEVFFALDQINSEEISSQVRLCETLGIPARISLGLFDLPQSKVFFMDMEHLPVVTFYTAMRTPIEAWLKRAIDIAVAMVGLLITGALIPWISWRIKKESKGPVIFKQVRVGENGRRFKCYKFRTMFVDAEEKKLALASQNKMKGPIFKIDNDPRITEFGKFLRKTSLDELPQFFNILRGDMSVVGTRPPTPNEVVEYEMHFRRRLSIRPGLTGLWQVTGRNNIQDFQDILALDLQYIDRWSLWLDIQIIFKTIWVTLFRQGAV